MLLYVVRHGKTVWNLEHRVQGITDIELCEEGRMTARAISEEVRNLNVDVVISSPLSRARETAKILVGDTLPINIDDRIKERDWGRNEGIV